MTPDFWIGAVVGACIIATLIGGINVAALAYAAHHASDDPDESRLP